MIKRKDLIECTKELIPFNEKDENINKRIEQLINNGYIAEDDKDKKILQYC